MGRKPRQEPLKEYLENPRTTWLFSSPTDFTEVFPQGDKATSDLYLKPATKGNRLGKGTFRIVLHLPNKHHNDRSAYLTKIEGGRLNRYLEGNPLEASRTRWDSGSYPSAELVLHTQKGKRVNFFLLPANHEKGAVVYATTSFPSPTSRKMVQCPVRVGYFGVSASRPGEFKLTLQKPQIECGKGLVAAGHAPAEFLKPEKKVKGSKKTVKAAETEGYMSEEDHSCFYEAQGLDMSKLLQIQDVEIMDSENEQAQERQYYNPSDAMVGNETLDGYTPSESTTVDLTSNQPTANYGAESKRMMCADCGSKKVMYAEGETATYSPSEEPDMVSSSSFDDPTNANFSAEGEPVAVAEGTSLTGYAPIDSIEEPAPIGHGVNQYFGSDTVEGALLDESTTGITIEEGVSLDGYSGIDSVAVEAPLGHGVTQWYAEDSPEPNFDEGITGQDGPSADPTNAHMKAEFSKSKGRNYARDSKGRIITHDAQGYDDKMDESLGMRHRGSHSQSMKDRRDEASAMDKGHSIMGRKYDDVMTMDAQGYDDKMDESLGMRHRGSHRQSMKDRRDEASAMDKRHSRMGRKYDDVMTMDADTAGYLQDGSLSMDGYTPLESVEVDRTSFQPTQNYGAEYAGETADNFKKGVGLGSGAVVGIALPGILLGTAGLLFSVLMGKSE
tara:strand:+ start:6314 stop:8320 length:2007 start_codon:yes stop_codon:yes gene_type:complete